MFFQNTQHLSIRLVLGLAIVLSIFTFTDAISANETNSPEQALLTINMRDADISEIIQWMAEQTGKNMIVDPRVKGKATVLSNAPMTVDQAYSVFLSLLDVYGYAATETRGILRIFPAAMAKSSPAQLIKNFDNYGTQKGQVLYVFKARNVSATKLSELLKPLIPPGGYISALVDTNTLILSDEMDNVKRLVDLITQLDQSGELSIEVIKLNYASAKNVADLAKNLLTTDSAAPFSIASDERSNSILLSGDESSKNSIRRFIARLDRTISTGGNTRVIHLNYLDAAEILPILRGISLAIVNDSKDVKEKSRTISIESSVSTNSIVMTAPIAILDVMSDVIAKIDIRRSQVLVEAVIIEVSQSLSKTLGVEWNSKLGQDDGIDAITNFGLKASLNEGIESSIIGPGLSLGFYRKGSLRSLVRAIANETGTNILSTPSIVTLDNQPAEILVGSNIPLISGQATSSATTDSPFTTIERKDIGLSLKITPQVNEGNSITLDIVQEIETVSNSVQVVSDVVTDKRSIKTRVLVENENILVLGGLISTENHQLVSKVPFLGNIPIIGALFRSTTDQITKKNLMVFIYPRIIDSNEKMQDVSRSNYDLMQDLRKKYSSGYLNNENNKYKSFNEFVPDKPSL